MTTAPAAAVATVTQPMALSVLRMTAHARLGTQLQPGPYGPRTHVSRLASSPPITLRPSIAKEPEPWARHAPDLARVSVAASAAGPVGGDHYRFDIHVGAGSTLVLTEVSATLLLPGPDGTPSRSDFRIQVDAGATFIWLPQPVIAAHRCDHLNDVAVDLVADSRLLIREQLLLGRHHEPSGRLRQRLRIRRDGRPLYAQDLDLGTATATSPAVTGGHRAVGSVLIVDPDWRPDTHTPVQLPGDAALLPVAAGTVLISALADDNLALRQQLLAGLAALGPPWEV